MIFRQYYLGCLSQISYMVGDETSGRAVVVDPHRDVSVYLNDASDAGLRIERVIETHFHADFLSGHLELAAKGASVGYGEAAEADFEFERLADGQRISLGQVELEIRATPGHTPESISVVVYEAAGNDIPYGVLTGDALFIGDVGRPDLLSAVGASSDELARQLYRSLRTRLLTLPDETQVFPAHGAGSACGKQLSTETSSTIGEQRRTNYALAPMSEDDFVRVVTEGQAAPPPYFAFDARRNREDHPLLDEDHPPPPLTLAALRAEQESGAVVLDTREPAEFAAGHLVRSLNVCLDGRFAEWAGDILDPDQRVVLVCDAGRELEAKVRLGRIGFDNIVGYLKDPLHALWEHPEVARHSSRLTAADLAARQAEVADLVVVDVRNPGELSQGTIPGSVPVPLARLVERMGDLDPSRPTVVYCAGGTRSMVAASTLASAGFADVSDLLGGYGAWSAWTTG